MLHWKSFSSLSVNIVFIVLMYICFSRDFFSALFWLFAFVMLQNSFDVPWKGSLAVSYIFLLVIIYIFETVLVFQYSFSTMLAIFFLILGQNVFHLMLGGLSMGFDNPFEGEISRLLLVSFVNVFISPFVFYLLYLLDKNSIFHFNKSKSFFGRRVGL